MNANERASRRARVATSNRHATAIAHPNIALAKYWGKLQGDANIPAVPSLSVTLAGMATTTTVSFDEALATDELVLNDVRVDAAARPHARAVELLDRARGAAGVSTRARVVTRNDFPTASGLASSASGFAALALASVRALGLDWSSGRVADLARRSSASAARSIFGGFVELDGGESAERLDRGASTRQLASPTALSMSVLVCVTTEAQKSLSSTEGMKATTATSPYYQAWLGEAPAIHQAMKVALAAGDFVRVGELAERSALAMHACAMASGIVYVTGATLAALDAVRAMRASGLAAFATIDAGPHLKCLVRSTDVPAARAVLARVPGVLRLIEAVPGEGARLVPASADDGTESERARGAGGAVIAEAELMTAAFGAGEERRS